MCQSLNYHRAPTPNTRSVVDTSSRESQERLFWSGYRIERGLALRFGRPSTIRDTEITIIPDEFDSRNVKLGIIHGRAYDELFSPAALLKDDHDRVLVAKGLAEDLKSMVDEIHRDIMVSTRQARIFCLRHTDRTLGKR